ncbi:MAG: threonine synthase [Candidatus Omnitrophica bacterium]|nr:threonine synthase [Candidatus Omnitrophota bacterium]
MSIKGVIERYRGYLPVSEKTPVVTLCEGNTALIRAKVLEDKLKVDAEIFLKYEGQNPTGSFKDRGMTMAVSKAKEDGIEAVMCASTGNTSASASAYAVRAGMKSFVVIPEGNIALGKLAQALIHGACVIAIKGNFDKALSLVKEITDEYPVALVNSLNPFRIEGQKTGAFEICDDLGEAPGLHFIPVGNAGNITAYWKGYKEYKEAGKITNLPRMMGFQAAGAAPIVERRIIERPETIATAIRIGNPASWKKAEAARDESGGVIDKVTDEEIIEAYKILAGEVGVFVEPASAASVAGLIKLSKAGYFEEEGLKGKRKKIVCVLTGHGLKDPERAIKCVSSPEAVEAKKENILKLMGY